MATWILTGSPENYAATAERGYRLIGMKERRRLQAQSMEPGDRIVLYLTKVKAFAAAIRLTGELFEDREPVWPGKPGAADPYPWRFESEPELVLEEAAWLPAEAVKDDLEHIRKWPAEHWTLAFQGQLRTISEHDARRPARGDACARRRGRRAVSLSGTLRSLPPESRMTGGAALALVVSLLLPWYQVSYFQGGEAVTDSRSALQVFTWIEASILLVALAVLYLVYARSQRQAFHLPGGDGFVVSAGGRLGARADRVAAVRQADVDERAATVGIQWGIFFSLLAAAALVAAGARVRAAGRPEPPNPTAEETEWEVPARARRERAADARPREHTEVTQVLRERPPSWDGEPAEAPGRAKRPARRARTNRRLRPTACSEQLPAGAGRCQVDAPRRPRRRPHARAARHRCGRAAVVGAAGPVAAAHLHRRRVDRLRPQRRRADWLALQDGAGAGARGGEAVAARSASGAVGPARSAPRGRVRGHRALRPLARRRRARAAGRLQPRPALGAAGRVRERGRRLREVAARRARTRGSRRRASPATRAATSRSRGSRTTRAPNDRVEVALRRAGGSFGAPLRLATGRVRSVSVAVGPRGDVLVAWDARGKIRTRLRRAGRRQLRADRDAALLAGLLRRAAHRGRELRARLRRLGRAARHRGRRRRPRVLRGGGAARGRRALPARPAARAARRRSAGSARSTSR